MEGSGDIEASWWYEFHDEHARRRGEQEVAVIVGGCRIDNGASLIEEVDGDARDSRLTRIVDAISVLVEDCLLYTSPSPRDRTRSRMPSSA